MSINPLAKYKTAKASTTEEVNPLAKYKKQQSGFDDALSELSTAEEVNTEVNPLAKYKKKPSGFDDALSELSTGEEVNPLDKYKPENQPKKDFISGGQLVGASKLAMGLVMPGAFQAYENLGFSDNVKNKAYTAFGQMALGWGDSLTFGLANYGLKQAGYQMPEADGKVEEMMRSTGELLGFISGPAKVGGKVASKIPIISKLYNPGMAITKPRALVQSVAQGALGLGVASGLMTPETGIGDMKARTEQFTEGAKTGAMFSVLGLDPNRITRILSMSAVSGIPATLAGMPLEDQVYKYGLGAYFGVHGVTLGKRMEGAKKFNQLKKLVNDGVPTREAAKQLFTSNKEIISKFDALTKGHEKAFANKRQQVETLLKTGDPRINKKGEYKVGDIKAEGEWKTQIIKNINKTLKKIKGRPELSFLEGNDAFLFNEFKLKRKEVVEKLKDRGIKFKPKEVKAPIKMLNDGQLLELSKRLELISKKNPDPYGKGRLVKGELLQKGRNILKTAWDRTFRPFGGVSKSMGTGSFGEEAWYKELVISEHKLDMMTMDHDAIVNNFKMMSGVSEAATTKVFRLAEGKLNPKYASHGQRAAARQLGNYYDQLLKVNNAYRARNGEPAIRRRKNYVTHIQDLMLEPYKTIDEVPDYVKKNVSPTKIQNRFGLKRTGNKGFKENPYDAVDAYARQTFRSVTDRPIRTADQINRYLTAVQSEHKRTGVDDNVNYDGIKKRLTEVSDDFSGKPGKYDLQIQHSIEKLNANLPEKLQLKSLGQITNFLQNMIYTSTMGFRPKLAIRNLGQNTLTIGEVGFKVFGKAIRMKNSKMSDPFQDSLVLSGRQKHFVPNQYDTKSGKFIGKAMLMYQGADWINVTNAFKSGYLESTGGKIVKKGTAQYKRAVNRGDQVAARTQYLYTRGNRSAVARGYGKSRHGGSLTSMFTTWAPNWAELMVTWAREKNQAAVARYLGINAVALAIGTTAGVNAFNYTGLNSVGTLKDMATGGLPIFSLLEDPSRLLTPGIVNDIQKAAKSGDMWDALVYGLNRK